MTKLKKILLGIILCMLFSTVSATETVDKLGLDEYVGVMEEHIKDSEIGDVFDVGQLSKDLVNGKGIEYKTILGKLVGIFFKEVLFSLKGAVSILLILILIALLKNLEIEEGSGIIQIADFVCFLSLAIILIANFLQVVDTFKGTITSVTSLMQVVSPFMMAVLLATGGITTTGMIQPLLLFVSSFIGYLITNVVIPFLCIAVAFTIIDSLNNKLGLAKISKLFSSSAMWIVGVVLTLFLGILSMQTTVTSSIDSLAIKTTSAAVSNFVPVVGKFFSDSFESVVGATKVVSSVGGIVGIIAIICTMLIPVIKIISISIIYHVLSALAEPICRDSKMTKVISSFASVYKTMTGILIGVSILFIISIGIILNIGSSIVK